MKERSIEISTQPRQTQRPVLFHKEISVRGCQLLWCSCKCLWGVWEADEGGVPPRAPFGKHHGRRSIHAIPSQNLRTSPPTSKPLAIQAFEWKLTHSSRLSESLTKRKNITPGTAPEHTVSLLLPCETDKKCKGIKKKVKGEKRGVGPKD